MKKKKSPDFSHDSNYLKAHWSREIESLEDVVCECSFAVVDFAEVVADAYSSLVVAVVRYCYRSF